MHDENVEKMTFEQVRKILKERNLRGTIKLTVRTYEGKRHCSTEIRGCSSFETTFPWSDWGWFTDACLKVRRVLDDRLDSHLFFSFSPERSDSYHLDIVDDPSQATTQHSRTPSPQKAMPSSTSPPKTTSTQSPVYTFLPYTPPSSVPLNNPSSMSTSLNIFAPKPFRSTNLDALNSSDTVRSPHSIRVDLQLISRRWPSREKNCWRWW